MTSTEREQPRSLVALIGLVAGPLLAALLVFAWRDQLAASGGAERLAMAAIAACMAVWWMTEALPLPATALVPLVAFPIFGVLSAGDTARQYGHDLVFLFLGGLLLALGVEESGLHRRVALAIVSSVGNSPRRLVLGFMLATAVLSMWMSNSATTLLLLPIGASVLSHLHGEGDGELTRRQRNFGVALMLGIAYAASIGGMATLVGTPTNVAFSAIFENEFKEGPQISFGAWILLAAPLSLAMLLATWGVLVFVSFPLDRRLEEGGSDAIARAREALGPMRPAEWRMSGIFLTTALLWVFREPVKGWGWVQWVTPEGADVLVTDSTVGLAMAVLCFLMPREGWRSPTLLRWETTRRLPWGVLLLFGGGIALAEGMSRTQLDGVLSSWFSARLQGQPPWLMAAMVSAGVTFLTELIANVSCVQLTMPVLAGVSRDVGCDPRLLMICATLAANCAFMLPVATPPNAIVYSSGYVRSADMLRAGFLLNMVGVVLVVSLVLIWGGFVMGIDPHALPSWAAAAN